MENVDLTGKVKNFIRFGLIGLLILSGVIGYGMFQHYHAEKILQIENAKVTSNIISVHALTNGKIKELPFEDGAEVKEGDVIAKIEVSVTEEDIKKLEQAVAQAKQNYESLKLGQRVKTPVRRTKTVPATTPAPQTNTSKNTASVATLEERAKRMDELYEMGAVSSSEVRKAKEDLAKAKVSSAIPSAPAPATTQTVEIDFVESLQPTPAAILESAQNAVKEAEMALNSAIEQSQQTEIVAPVNGVVYYSYVVDEEVKAGDIVAKVGDDKNIWIEAEVTEDIFNQVSLGKKVSYTIDGHILSGTVTEKIAPPKPEPVKEEIVEEPTETSAEQSKENLPEEKSSTESSVENKPVEEKVAEDKAVEDKSAEDKTTEENSPEEVVEEKPDEGKFILKVSVPSERDFDLKLLSETTLKVSL